jgi:hypothetical protein
VRYLGEVINELLNYTFESYITLILIIFLKEALLINHKKYAGTILNLNKGIELLSKKILPLERARRESFNPRQSVH